MAEVIQRVSIKHGVLLHNPANPKQTISSVWGVALPVVASLYYPHDCVITSGFDGSHKVGSLHYVGRALDFRTYHVASRVLPDLRANIADALGFDFDVVLEKDHLHIEYDPK